MVGVPKLDCAGDSPPLETDCGASGGGGGGGLSIVENAKCCERVCVVGEREREGGGSACECERVFVVAISMRYGYRCDDTDADVMGVSRDKKPSGVHHQPSLPSLSLFFFYFFFLCASVLAHTLFTRAAAAAVVAAANIDSTGKGLQRPWLGDRGVTQASGIGSQGTGICQRPL